MPNLIYCEGFDVSFFKKIKERRQLDYLPSACQIRYGGCKGMVAVDPTLGSEKIIQVQSQYNT